MESVDVFAAANQYGRPSDTLGSPFTSSSGQICYRSIKMKRRWGFGSPSPCQKWQRSYLSSRIESMSLGFSLLQRTTDSRRCRQRMQKTGLSAFVLRLVSMKRTRLSSPRPGTATQENRRASLMTAPVNTRMSSKGGQASRSLCARSLLAKVEGDCHAFRITLETILLPTPSSPMLLQTTLSSLPQLRYPSHLRLLPPIGDHRCALMRLSPVSRAA